jgi:thioredoxin reductase (NADPH)
METNVPGLYVAGTAAAGTQQRFRLFIENCHEHVAKIMAALTGRPYEPAATLKDRQYEV